MRALRVTLVLVLGLSACNDQTEPPDIVPTMAHTFEALSVASGGEVSGVCQSWTLGNEGPLYVSKIRQRNDGSWHHSNWFFVPEETYPGPDGTWDCDERSFHDVSAALAGGVFFAQSTQALQELQAFQEGAVLEIPPHHKIVGGVHLLNISAAPLDTALHFDIEPQAESRFGMTCNVGEQFDKILGTPAEYDIYYVLAHYHEWGNYFRLSFVDDEGADRTIFELRNRVGEPLGMTLEPPISSQGASKLRVECGYLNDTDRRLHYGLGGQEMCVFLAYTNADLIIGASSGTNTPTGQNAEGVFINETECGVVLAVPAN